MSPVQFSADNSISIIEILGLVGEKCQSCKEAAEAEDGGGLAGSWWRAWGYVSEPKRHWLIIGE